MRWFQPTLAACGGLVVACSFSASLNTAPIDALPDAGECAGASRECVGSMLRECAGAGAMAVDTPCDLGCMAGPPDVHCAVIDPHGGGATADDMKPDPQLIAVELDAGITIDSDNGRIGTGGNPTSVRGSGTNVINGIDYQQRANNIVVFRFKSLRIKGALTLTGTHAIAIVADGNITIEGVVDARGACAPPNPGPGGLPGIQHDTLLAATTTGASTDTNLFGGGGGGSFGTGGLGAGGQAGGMTFGDADITALRGGGGGGGGGGGNESGDGGGGGGAIQLVSNHGVAINDVAGINAGGCGGETGMGGNDGGGGGGAGGTILIEARTVKLDGALAANGGGGGGGDANPDTTRANGEAGRLDKMPAAGFPLPEAKGGNGGADTAIDGSPGEVSGTGDGGGGGGAVGRIRVNTADGSVMLSATSSLSPATTTGATTFGVVRLR